MNDKKPYKNELIDDIASEGSWKTIIFKDGTVHTVPIDAPVDDPCDPNSFVMTPLPLLNSTLSISAKMAYITLRSHTYKGLGYSFVTMEKLGKRMSRRRNAVTPAIRELVESNVIRVVNKIYSGLPKNYFYFLPEREWNLPQEIKKRKPNIQSKPKPQTEIIEKAQNVTQLINQETSDNITKSNIIEDSTSKISSKPDEPDLSGLDEELKSKIQYYRITRDTMGEEVYEDDLTNEPEDRRQIIKEWVTKFKLVR